MRPLNLTWLLAVASLSSTMSFIRSNNPSVYRLATSTTNILLQRRQPNVTPSLHGGAIALSMQQRQRQRQQLQRQVSQDQHEYR